MTMKQGPRSKPRPASPLESGSRAVEAEARRQSKLVAADTHEVEDQAFVDAISRGLMDAEI
ncbi:MAG TPA: antitoxin MazE-like protein [Allosphingosinicella sp.]|nr:antitoxin MazE-like protein [Allosphingosinicella sp.]